MKQSIIAAFTITACIISTGVFANEAEEITPVVTRVVVKERPKLAEPETYPVAKTDVPSDPEEMERLRKHAANIESANSNRVFGDIFAEVIKLILR